MGLPVVWVWTHDSVGARRGRARPTSRSSTTRRCARSRSLWVIRPADANETARRLAGRAGTRGRPGRAAALAPEHPGARPLARSPRPRGCSAAATCCGTRAGRRARADPDRDRRRGRRRRSQAARSARRARARRVRVVSMPCMELFEAQPRGVPRAGAAARRSRARLAVEPGASMSWWQWVGDRRRRARARPLRRLRTGYDGAREARLQRREHRRPRAGAARDATPTEGDAMPADAPRPLQRLSRARPERVGRLPLARVDPRRAPAGADRRLRRRRRDLEPDDLPEGDDRRGRLRRAARTSSPSDGADADADLLGARRAGHPGGLRRVPARVGRAASAATATSRSRSTRAWPTTRSRPSARRCACTRRSTART